MEAPSGAGAAGLVLAGALAVLAGLLTAGALDNGAVWDDPVILHQQLPRWASPRDAFLPPAGVPDATGHYYRPLVVLSYQLDRAIAGEVGSDPSALLRALHASGIALHGLATALVALIGLELARRRGPGPALALPALAGLLFAVHPIHAESVAWIAGRSDTLCAVFALAAALCWLRARRTPSPALALAGGAAVLAALLAKETGIGLALVAPALLLAPTPADPRWRRPREAALALGATAAAIVAYALLRAVAIGGAAGRGLRPGALADLLGSLGWYAVKLVWPPPQCALVGVAPDGAWIAVGLAVLAGGALFLGWAARRRGWEFELQSFALALGLLAPSLAVAALVVAKTPVAERYLYLPSAGACLLAAGLLTRLPPAWLGPVCGLLLALPAAAALRARVEVFHDPRSFWESTARTCRGHGQPPLELGRLHAAQGQHTAAIAAYERALALYAGEQPGTSWTLNNLANSLRASGRLPQAIETFRRALEGYPDYALARYNLALALLEQARSAPDPGPARREALQQLERAVALDPSHPGARLQLGLLLSELGRRGEAEAQWREVERLAPGSRFAARAREALEGR